MSKQKAEFIQQLFQELELEDYLLLKFPEERISEIDNYSDLDIFLPKKKLANDQKFCRK